jgi:hypothetical protein
LEGRGWRQDGAAVLRSCSAAVEVGGSRIEGGGYRLEVEVQVKVEGYTKSPENKVPIQELCRLMGNGVRAEMRKYRSNV